MLFSLKNPRPIVTNLRVLVVVRGVHAIYQLGGLFNLVCHPQVIGRPAFTSYSASRVYWISH
jgi:peptidoglycan-N-acetylglucosamine deacetylase